jgi:hypothetical protein
MCHAQTRLHKYHLFAFDHGHLSSTPLWGLPELDFSSGSCLFLLAKSDRVSFVMRGSSVLYFRYSPVFLTLGHCSDVWNLGFSHGRTSFFFQYRFWCTHFSCFQWLFPFCDACFFQTHKSEWHWYEFYIQSVTKRCQQNLGTISTYENKKNMHINMRQETFNSWLIAELKMSSVSSMHASTCLIMHHHIRSKMSL